MKKNRNKYFISLAICVAVSLFSGRLATANPSSTDVTSAEQTESDSLAENRVTLIPRLISLLENPISDVFETDRTAFERKHEFYSFGNELVVVNWAGDPSSVASYYHDVELVDEAGENVDLYLRYYDPIYHAGANGERFWVFRLPEPGVYELTLYGGFNPLIDDIGLSLDDQPREEVVRLHALHISVADAEERSLIEGAWQLQAGDGLEAIERFTEAIALNPDRAGGYFGRLAAYVSYSNGLYMDQHPNEPLSQNRLERVETLFQILPAEQQATALDDLRTFSTLLPGDDENLAILSELSQDWADFLETGAVSERLMEAL